MSIGAPAGFINFTNGTPRADKIIATSNIGIGTNAPAYELDVVGNVHANSFHLENFFISSSQGLDHVTNENNSTGDTIISTNVVTGFQASSNVVIGGDIHVSGNIYQNGSEFISVGALETTTDAIIMPSGTTAERPSTAVEGMLRHNSTTGYFEYYTSGGWSSIVTSPGVISVSPNPFAYANTTTEDITINGSFFDNQSVVRLQGVDGTTYNTTNFLFVDSSTIRFKIGTLASGQFANRPYRVLVTDRLGLTTKSAETLRFGQISITSFSPTTIAYANVTTEDITVYGTFFDNGSTVQLEGADGTTLYNTTDFIFDNSSTIRFKMGTLASGQGANRPYKIVVTDTAGVTAKSTQTLGFEGPTWSSPASGSTQEFSTASSTTLTLSATDAIGGSSVSYSVVGSLPGGLTLSGSTISGTSTESDGTLSTVIIRATDTLDTSAYTDLTFTIETIDALYSFTSHTFTNAGQTGRLGPTLSQLTSAYTPSWTDNTNYLNVTTQGIQEWTVPQTGTYEIEVAGARGGHSYITSTQGSGGKGGWTKGLQNLTINTVLKLIVGQAGLDGPANDNSYSGGGGGASWVLSSNLGTLYAVAGGGGGCNGTAWSAARGTDGGSSQANVSDTGGGNYGNYSNGGGAGFGGNGLGVGGSNIQTGGYSPANGALGALGNQSWSTSYAREGGFGGGGGNGAHAGGGGAGYAGGDGVNYNLTPGAYGGTTRNNMTSPTFSTHTADHGYIKITLIQ
jgi:hypothetical protein